MKIRSLKIAIAFTSLLIPMACMHLGDDHHSGYGSCYSPSEPLQQSIQSFAMETEGVTGQVKMTT